MQYRAYRFPCEHPVVVSHHGERLPAQIINISNEGARLSGLGGLAPGERLRLELGQGCPVMQAEVRWTRGTLAGLRFDAPLAPRDLALIRRSVASGTGVAAKAWNLQLRELR